jgi:hypothetical protein
MNTHLASALLRQRAIAAVVAALAITPTLGLAQQPQPQGSTTTTVVTPSLDLSGVFFGSYTYRTDSAGKAATGGANPNQFNIDRAYLNFRMPAGENGSIRITTEVYQNTNAAQNSYYQGWGVRLKYAYAQYNGFKETFGTGSAVTGRLGILHTVIIDHLEQFWPRYLGLTAVERNGFMSSADGGAAALVTLGDKMGEIYTTITNGSGYTSYDHDRFKDYAARVSLTPLGNQKDLSPILRSFAISPWIYKGMNGSSFAAGGTGQVGPGTNGAITDGLKRDRYGVFAGVRERRISAGVDWAQRLDDSETGSNTAAAPRAVHDSTGRLMDAFIVGRPLEWANPSSPSPLSVIARFDHFTPNTGPTAAAYAGTTPSINFLDVGGSWDLNQRLTLALDWQKQTSTGFPPPTGTNLRAPADASNIVFHLQALF